MKKCNWCDENYNELEADRNRLADNLQYQWDSSRFCCLECCNRFLFYCSNYEQKFEALKSLCEHRLLMRSAGDWYVDCGLEIKDGPILSGSYGNGKTPEEAINNHWDIYSNVRLPQTVVIKAHTNERREVIWNGFMWKEVN